MTTAHHHMAESEWPQSLPLDVSRTLLCWCLEGSYARPHGNKHPRKGAALIPIHAGNLWRSSLQNRRIFGCCSPALVRYRLVWLHDRVVSRLTANTSKTCAFWEGFVKPLVVILYIQQVKKIMFACLLFCFYKKNMQKKKVLFWQENAPRRELLIVSVFTFPTP